MPWRVRFTPLAGEDVAGADDAYDVYNAYEGARGGLGAAFLDDVGRAVALAGEHPAAGKRTYRAANSVYGRLGVLLRAERGPARDVGGQRSTSSLASAGPTPSTPTGAG